MRAELTNPAGEGTAVNLSRQRALRSALPAVSLVLLLLLIWAFNPRAISYFGLNLMLNLAIPIALATIAQMCVMATNELDLSIGAFIGYVACVTGTFMASQPALAVLMLAAGILVYMLAAAVIYMRAIPSIVVTLGLSFFWGGLALLIRPTPGGRAPEFLTKFLSWQPPLVPLPVVLSLVLALSVHLLLMSSSYGTILRGSGGNERAIGRAGWSILKAKVTMFALAGFFGVLSGMLLVGVSSSADATMASGYTLLSIAGAVIGGAEFVGGRISPIGAVIGALVLQLASSALNFLQVPFLPGGRIPQEWQVGAQGFFLILILAARVLISRSNSK
ncbi:ABC transporter permease [Rhizobium rosettiformans]|uniref:ABC transporter permease n=1 Tax=Rhizobium rosettiformans TaxID=1368430 RepID=UPI00285822C4|nr:ABC transporter permease [Rhizobium rosettiformans]MDR7030861.1 ribose transport system permease protein [Rhizobium rosettiformans]MDR7066845.1 ribose transport system permease protein [Rhizobium rosettiformans]